MNDGATGWNLCVTSIKISMNGMLSFVPIAIDCQGSFLPVGSDGCKCDPVKKCSEDCVHAQNDTDFAVT